MSLAFKAKKNLRRLGIPLPPQPTFDPDRLRLPKRIDTLPMRRVTQEMNRWSQMLAYVKAELALAEIRRREAKDTHKRHSTVEFLRLRELNPKSSVTDLKAQLSQSKRLTDMEDKIALYEAKYELLLAVHEGYDQNYKLLSRELTRRTSQVERGVDD